jgi:tripartite-type tricarboxylate transporter receptor subunit TctC
MTLSRRHLLAAPATLLPLAAEAQRGFPDHPVTMIVPFAPGGAPDIAARIVVPKMTELLGQSVVVENRAGAGSVIGTRAVVQARPDGYTALMGSISFMLAPLTMDPHPFDPAATLRVVSLMATVPYVLVVRADAPPKTLAEFHRWVAAAPPGSLNYGSAGSGTPLHMGGAMYDLFMGTRMTHVAYRGTSPALQDLLGGQVQMAFADLPGAAAHIRAGTLRMLAVLVPDRLPAYPGVPTMKESDPRLADYDIYTWAMLCVPKATPDGPVQRLYQAALGAALDPTVITRLHDLGFDITATTPEAGDAILAREQAKWDRLIKAAGIKVDL